MYRYITSNTSSSYMYQQLYQVPLISSRHIWYGYGVSTLAVTQCTLQGMTYAGTHNITSFRLKVRICSNVCEAYHIGYILELTYIFGMLTTSNNTTFVVMLRFIPTGRLDRLVGSCVVITFLQTQFLFFKRPNVEYFGPNTLGLCMHQE
jgi:hypothetical protein